MNTIDDAIAKLLEVEELDTYQGTVTEADVDSIATATGCSLPNDYRQFLLRFGFAIWVGHSIYGVYDPTDERFPPSYNFSAVEATLRARALHQDDPYPFLLDSLVIDVDGMGGYFLLVSESADTPNRVMWVNQDETWVLTKSWSTFASFLHDHASL